MTRAVLCYFAWVCLAVVPTSQGTWLLRGVSDETVLVGAHLAREPVEIIKVNGPRKPREPKVESKVVSSRSSAAKVLDERAKPKRDRSTAKVTVTPVHVKPKPQRNPATVKVKSVHEEQKGNRLTIKIKSVQDVPKPKIKKEEKKDLQETLKKDGQLDGKKFKIDVKAVSDNPDDEEEYEPEPEPSKLQYDNSKWASDWGDEWHSKGSVDTPKKNKKKAVPVYDQSFKA